MFFISIEMCQIADVLIRKTRRLSAFQQGFFRCPQLPPTPAPALAPAPDWGSLLPANGSPHVRMCQPPGTTVPPLQLAPSSHHVPPTQATKRGV